MSSKKSETKKVQENPLVQNLPFLPYNPWSTAGMYQDSWLTGAWGYSGVSPYSLAARYNDGSGMTRPVYLTAFQKKQITDSARELAFFNEYCSAAIKIMQDYVVGTGFEYRVVPTKDGVNDKLVQQAQELVDLFCEHNDIFKFENEIVWRMLVEGEIITRIFYEPNGLISFRVVEPELLLPPNDSNNPNSSFGIECRNNDIQPSGWVGFWIVEEPWKGLTPVLVPAEEVNFMKDNTPYNCKRGLPKSFPVDSNFRTCESVLQSMVSLANARSKVAMIRKLEGGPPEAVEALRDKTTNLILNDPQNNQKLNIERMPYGSILTSSANISYEFPDIGAFAEECKETLQTNIRAICAHYGISEIQMSQNITTRTYASANVAESPASKNYIRWQKMLGEFIAGKRTKPQQSIMWKQIVYAVEKGMLPNNALSDLKISYRGPSVITRDIKAEAETNRIYADMGIKSNEAIAAEIGMDYEQQKKNKQVDDGLDNLLATVAKLNAAGLDPEGSKVLFKKYHPAIEDDVVNKLFTKQVTPNEPLGPKKPKDIEQGEKAQARNERDDEEAEEKGSQFD